MGAFWSGPQRQSESITRQKLQQSTIREIAAIEECIYCYVDIRLGSLLGPFTKRKHPWDSPHTVSTLYTSDIMGTINQRSVAIAPKANSEIMCPARYLIDYITRPPKDANVRHHRQNLK